PFYPINALRNIAVQYAQTDYVFLIDVDFLPSLNSYPYFEEVIQTQAQSVNRSDSQKARDAKWCFVIPAFELFAVRYGRLPDTKQALLEHLNNESIKPFRHEVWTAGHMATDYERWKNTSSIYAVRSPHI
ncbi:hypothetical protein AHF37_12397, partial [Paragonimus kellicotti]